MPFVRSALLAMTVVVVPPMALLACDDASRTRTLPAPHAEGLQPASASAAMASVSTSSSIDTAPAASMAVAAAAKGPTGPWLSTTHLISWVFEKPKLDAPHAGYLRVGEKAVRSATKLETTGCAGGWYSVEPSGFVCAGHDGVTIDDDDPSVVAAATYAPDFTTPLPYGYGTTTGTPLYTRIPTADEQRQHEGDVAAHAQRVAAAREKMDPEKLPPFSAVPIKPIPSFLEDHAQAPNAIGWPLPKAAVTAGYAWGGMRLSFLTAFESEGRAFYLTTEHLVVPVDRVRAARLADFKGVELARPGDAGEHLPMIWQRWRSPKIHKLENERPVETAELFSFQAHASIAPKERIIDNVRWFELLDATGTPDGRLVRVDSVTRVDAASELPFNVGPNDAWVEVSIGRQSLVLYQGLTPVFATLVSTGVDGVADIETTRSTPRGSFRIHSKHLSYRMSADEHEPWKEGDKPDPKYRIDDVPYVQYFHGGYALHAAYWHDAFGNPKSHGCINLSPRDALWMFSRTLPLVPSGWHGVYSGRGSAAPGTYLVVRAY